MNHAYEEFFRVSKADIEGKTVAEILGPHVDVSQSPLGKALAGERLVYRTTLKHSVTNEERILDVHYIPDIRPSGEAGGIVVLGNDVTELVRALRDRDLFLSTASHELKTPLTAMLLQTQLQNRRDGGTQYSLFMEKHTRRLSVLVDDMLDVSRIRTGKIALEFRTFDLSSVVREVVSELHDERFHISVANAVMITADEHRVEQVLMNLLSNAQKYGGTGPVHIEVLASEDSAFVIVDDSGPGIPEEARDKIFGVYERGEGTNGIQGLGLGLFIAKSLMDNMGGKLELEPKFPGARFRMTFPLHRT